MPLALAGALSRAAMAIDADYLRAEYLPDGTRQALTARRQELFVALVPAEQDRIRLILATLADMPTAAEHDPAKARFALERDVADLSGMPEWALAAAARAYRKGEVGDGKWRPTAGEVARLARAKCDAARAEAAKIAKVLAAKIDTGPKIDAVQRDELGAMVSEAARRKQVADEIRGRLAGIWKAPDDRAVMDPRGMPEGPARREVEANLAEHLRGLAADIRANPPQMSAALRASLGIARKDAA